MASMRKLSPIQLNNKKAGLTLLEILLSISILAILGVSVMGVILQFQTQSDLDSSVLTAVEALRQAEEFSRSAKGDSPWGVKFATGSVTIFQGQSFALRNAAFDEALIINPEISITGNTELVFFRFAATTTNAGTTTLLHTSSGFSRAIFISDKGRLDY